jgi:cholesterol oxidase
VGEHWDVVVVGSGFGGSVSALRLAEKGHRVLLLEKGRRFAPSDLPRSNWDVRRWMWFPPLGLRGLFSMTFLPHLTVLHGVGVGGGSLVYANTLPVPKEEFFRNGSWAGLADWQAELRPHYATAQRMLGATRNPRMWPGDEALRRVARRMGREEAFEPTDVGVFFGEPGKTVPDPFFGGEGPDRTGCLHCGGCMLGCQHGAKNTLDKNYLYLAEKRGLTLHAQTEVTSVEPHGGGYRIVARAWGENAGERVFEADRVVLAGGVLGTVDLLLRMKETRQLPELSDQVGSFVRTNSEALIGVTSERRDTDFDQGVAITSILHTDAHSHVEPVRYPRGSGFYRLMAAPHAPSPTMIGRMISAAAALARHPVRYGRLATVPDWARYTQILLYMRTLEGSITLSRGRSAWSGFRRALQTALDPGTPAPDFAIPEATEIARMFAEEVDGTPMSLFTETLLGIPTTAHILGGACIGSDRATGVIGADHQVFGHRGLYVVDGSAVSANPGVNPSLTITAMAERAMAALA